MPVAGGIDLARHHAAAGPGLALQHQHLLAGLGEIGRRDQAVVARPHRDDVVAAAHRNHPDLTHPLHGTHRLGCDTWNIARTPLELSPPATCTVKSVAVRLPPYGTTMLNRDTPEAYRACPIVNVIWKP